jgi:hypothetical protein
MHPQKADCRMTKGLAAMGIAGKYSGKMFFIWNRS